MHTTQVGDITFHHNGDYSGDVIIDAKEHNGRKGRMVDVPFAALLQLVAEKLRMEMISAIEQMEPFELLRTQDPDMLAIEAMMPRLLGIYDEDPEPFDDLVHDLANKIGSSVNNTDLDGQIGFIVEQLGPAEAAKSLKGLIQ